jgi:hypothetical protein
MLIGVYGSTDKRPVIYALIKLLQANGDVALLSNNRQYLRLLAHGETQGHMANVMISVSDASPDEIFEEVGYTVEDFDHIIFDIQDTIPDNLTLIINVKSFNPSEEEQSLLELLDSYTTVKVIYDGRRERNTINIAPVFKVWKTIEQIETYQILAPIPSKELNKGLAALIAPLLNIKYSTALTLLTRRWST